MDKARHNAVCLPSSAGGRRCRGGLLLRHPLPTPESDQPVGAARPHPAREALEDCHDGLGGDGGVRDNRSGESHAARCDWSTGTAEPPLQYSARGLSRRFVAPIDLERTNGVPCPVVAS